MLKYFRHLSFLITMANAKFCPFEDKMLYSKSHRICIYSQGCETGPKPALWFYESGCEEGFHRLPSANVITLRSSLPEHSSELSPVRFIQVAHSR